MPIGSLPKWVRSLVDRAGLAMEEALRQFFTKWGIREYPSRGIGYPDRAIDIRLPMSIFLLTRFITHLRMLAVGMYYQSGHGRGFEAVLHQMGNL